MQENVIIYKKVECTNHLCFSENLTILANRSICSVKNDGFQILYYMRSYFILSLI